jgi:hypothetical protein
MGEPIDYKEFLVLADSLIANQPIERSVISFVEKICGCSKETTARLGRAYYLGFLQRNGDKVQTTKVSKRDIKR